MGILFRFRRSWCCAALLAMALVSGSAAPVHGQNSAEPSAPSPTPDLEGLRQMIREELKAEQARKEEAEAKDRWPWSVVGKDLRLASVLNNGAHMETADKAFRFHLGGRLEWDNAWFSQDNNLLMGSDPTVRLEDGTDFRRARLRADGRVWEFIDFALEVNFANIQDVSNVENQSVQIGSVGLTDFNLTFREVPLVGNLRAGHFRAPYSLERYSSSINLNYMERSPVFDAFFGPNSFQNGVMVFNSFLNDRVTLATSFTRIGRATLNSFGFSAGDGEYATGLRMTGLPLYQDEGRTLLHLGVNYYHQALENNQFAVANRMLLRAGGGSTQVPNLLATGTFFSPNGSNVVDLEAAFVRGPFALSGEYAVAWGADAFESFNGVTFAGPRGNITYQALYVEGGYFLTPGDQRSYDKKTGTWGRTIPQENAFLARQEDGGWCHGRGAVQLLARYTYLDLVSGSPTLTPTSGGARAGIQQDVTLGVNWYLNPQTYVMLNYVWTHINSVVPGASGDIHGIGTRLHFDF